MTSENNGMMYMPVAPAYGAGNAGGMGFDGFGGGWGLLLLLAILGWGNGGYGFGGFGGGGMFPWMMGGQMNTNNDVQRGFDQSAVMSGINGIQNAVTTGFGNVQTALCSGFANVNAGISNGFAQAEIANNARQIADLQQMFALQSSMQNCCCQQSANTADLKYTVATEACADRNAISNALRDVLENSNASTQRILDQMCQDKIDAKNEKIAELQNQLTMANLAASQRTQTQTLLADNAAQTAALEQYLAPVPRPAYMVQNPNCCSYNYGCGCGN